MRSVCLNNHKKRQKTDGFTLVELIVTLVVLSILAAISVPAVLGFVDEGKAKECQAYREALAEEVVSARMAREVDGTTGENPSFDAAFYVENAELKCPANGHYRYESNQIVCDVHGKTALPDGKYSVSVADVSVPETAPQSTEPESQEPESQEPESQKPSEPESESETEPETQTEPGNTGGDISLNMSSMLVSLRNQDKMILQAILSGNVKGQWVNWSVSPAGIIELAPYNSGNGWGNNDVCGFKPLSVGTCVVTARLSGSDDAFATCEITTYRQLDSIGLSADDTGTIHSGDQVQLKVSYDPEDATFRDVTFTSNRPDIASIDANGLVTVKKVDQIEKASFTVDCPQPEWQVKPFTYNFDVFPLYPTRVHADPAQVCLYLGAEQYESQKVNLVVDEPKSADVILNVASWQTTNEAVASVDADGTIHARSTGSCVVKAFVSADNWSSITVEIPVTVGAVWPLSDGERGEWMVSLSSWDELKTLIKDTDAWGKITEGQTRVFADSQGNVYALRKNPVLFNSDWYGSIDNFIANAKNGGDDWTDALVKVSSGTVKSIGDAGIAPGDIVAVTKDGKTRYYVVTEEYSGVLTAENITQYGGEIPIL